MIAAYLVLVVDELQGELGVGQLHGLQQGAVRRLASLQGPLTPVWSFRISLSCFHGLISLLCLPFKQQPPVKQHTFDYYIVHSLAESTLFTGLEVAPVHSPCPSEAQGQAEQQDRRHAAKDCEQLDVKLKTFTCLTPTRCQITDVQTVAKVQHAGVKLR